jgi:hypothetical protein
VRYNANGWVLAQQVRKANGNLKYDVLFDRHDAAGNVEHTSSATSTVLPMGTTTSR